jgi:hypothetical protein
MNPTLRKPALAVLVLLLLIGTAGGLLLRGSDKSSSASNVEPNAKLGDADNSKAVQEHRQLLETVGTLTSVHCYQTYLNIGLIADGKAKGTYSDKDAMRLLDSILSLLDSVDRKLAKLAKGNLDTQDRESLEQMRDLADLLYQQGKDLKAYWSTGKEEDEARYENTRKDSWAALGKLTGIGRQ